MKMAMSRLSLELALRTWSGVVWTRGRVRAVGELKVNFISFLTFFILIVNAVGTSPFDTVLWHPKVQGGVLETCVRLVHVQWAWRRAVLRLLPGQRGPQTDWLRYV